MKHFFSALFLVLFATSMMAQQGLACGEDAIPVTKDFKVSVDGYCEKWFTATTYDLPIKVYFTPETDVFWGPDVQIDLTCTPGVYDDPKVDSLINLVSAFDISFPVNMMTEPGEVVNGKTVWELSVPKSYREQLAEFGVTYPVQAFVKVTFYDPGTISLTPDTAFTSCMENADSVTLGDTIEILANDVERVFLFPYTEWQEDSIRFVWTGEGTAQVYVAVQECSFTTPESPYIFDNFAIAQDAPHKLYSEEMKATMKEQQEGGIYYAKVIAPSAGKFVVEKIPLSPILGGAQLLEYDTEIVLEDTLYCFPRTWSATQLIATTDQPLTMYISNTPDFTASAEDDNVLVTCVASLEDASRAIYLSSKEMSNLINQAVGDHMYVRFACDELPKLSINKWNASECADKSLMLYPDVPQFVEAKSSGVVYRMCYKDFAGYPMTIKWNSTNRLPLFILENCTYTVAPNDRALLLNPAPSIASGQDYTIDAEIIDSWASRIADDGYFYVRFNPENPGTVTFVSDRVSILDPIYTTITDTLCFGKEYDWDGTIYTESGTYEQKYTALNGADSTVTLNLTILPEVLPTTDEVSVRYDELPYLWNDSAFTESTVYTATLQNKYGCDSVVTLKLTVLEKSDIKTTDDVMLNLASAFKVYTMDHTDWVADDVKVNWEGASPLHVFVAKEEIYNLTPFNRYVLHYEVVPAGEEWVVTKEQMAAWEAEATAAGGKLYVRFLTEKDGRLTTVPMD